MDANSVGKIVENIIESIFSKAKHFDAKKFVQDQVRQASDEVRLQLLQAKRERERCGKDIEKWESLMLSSIEGSCVFSPEQVKKQLDKLQLTMEEQNARITELESRCSDAKWSAEQILQQHQCLLTWADLFRDASLDEKKMIVSNLVKAVTISRDYGITIDFAIDEAQYLTGLSL